MVYALGVGIWALGVTADLTRLRAGPYVPRQVRAHLHTCRHIVRTKISKKIVVWHRKFKLGEPFPGRRGVSLP
jgi:hypothetical protein